MPSHRRLLPAAISIASLLAAACAASPTSGPPSPTPSEQPTASGSAFTLDVIPTDSVGKLFSGAPYVLLVAVSGTAADGPVSLTATASGAEVSVEPADLDPGAVGEVTLVPAPVGSETALEVAVTASRGGVEVTERRTLTVTPETDSLGPEAADHFAPFVSWLAANRPDLGITAATQWQGMPGAWVLIVSHYLYFSADWEAGLAWHVMIPPDDWSTLCLRHRRTEIQPSVAFKISSVAGATVPVEIPPEGVWR